MRCSAFRAITTCRLRCAAPLPVAADPLPALHRRHAVPVPRDDGVAVLGINTARSLTFKDGRINDEQIAFIRETFSRTDRAMPSRILVTHHPLFALPVGERARQPIGRQELALDAIADAGVDLLLAGHAIGVDPQRERPGDRAGGALVVQAGTATRPAARRGAELQRDRDRDGCVRSRSTAGTATISAGEPRARLERRAGSIARGRPAH